MSSTNFSSNLIERSENYMPKVFYDINDQIDQRVYTHRSCAKSASYSAFIKSMNSKGFICPRCHSKINNIFYNKILSNAILHFQNSFYLRNDEGAKNSYNLALLLNKEDQFEYVTLICQRALKFITLDETNKQNLKVLLNHASDRIFQTDFAIKTNLDKIESLTDDLTTCEEKAKISNDKHKIEKQNNHIVLNLSLIACDKNIIAKIYLDKKMYKEATDRFKDSIFFYEKALNVQSFNFEDKSPILKSLISNLINLGDLFFSLKKINTAAIQYEKSINFLKQSIESCKEKSELKQLQARLDKVFFSLSKTYILLADKLCTEKKEYLRAKEYYKKAQTTLENIKEKNNSIEFLSKSISKKLDINLMYQKIAFAVNLTEEKEKLT